MDHKLYKFMRKCERKWRRYGRAKRVALHHGNSVRAVAMDKALMTWLSRYNGAVMHLYPEDYQ
jgi:hypothetical protein